jgi:hypothetical protein
MTKSPSGTRVGTAHIDRITCASPPLGRTLYVEPGVSTPGGGRQTPHQKGSGRPRCHRGVLQSDGHPGPPQIRTCGTTASGSSGHGFAARGRRLRRAPCGEGSPRVASFASFAICSSFVEMVVKPDVFVIFPSNSCVSRCRPLLRGVPWVGSPTSLLLLRHSDSPSPPLRFAFALLGSSTSRWRRQGLPGSWGILPCMPCSPTPVGPQRRASRASPCWSLQCCLPLFRRRRLPRLRLISGLYHTAYMIAVYASRPRLPVYFFTAPQDSLPAGGPPWPSRT